MTPEQKTAYDLQQSGMTRAQISAHMGISEHAVKRRLSGARKWLSMDPEIASRLQAKGYTDAAALHSGWIIDKDENGAGESLYFFLGRDQDNATKFVDVLTDNLKDYKPLDRSLFSPRVNSGAKGDKLLVLDLADVHFGKLCLSSETGYDYNVDVARHRVIEGTKRLLQRSDGIARILFVMGNDILHTDNGRTSTTGTPQDSDGSYFTAWRAAQFASTDAIGECAAVAETDLIHCMSNHDWRSGWALSQAIASTLRGHDGVRATPYNLSERHRKYYGFGRNGLMLTHGDGAKEESLTSLFLREARNMVSQTELLYAYLHHFHHKKRSRRGVDVFMSEKDHTAFTQINMGASRVEGVDMIAEYVRSPSDPDGWHDRNGYVNRQAVEAFEHCPHDGQITRFTEWF